MCNGTYAKIDAILREIMVNTSKNAFNLKCKLLKDIDDLKNKITHSLPNHFCPTSVKFLVQ